MLQLHNGLCDVMVELVTSLKAKLVEQCYNQCWDMCYQPGNSLEWEPFQEEKG